VHGKDVEWRIYGSNTTMALEQTIAVEQTRALAVGTRLGHDDVTALIHTAGRS